MRLLLDTHIVLWQLGGLRELSSQARDAVAGADALLFSVVSFAEIGVKASIGKLVVPDGLRQYVLDSGVQIQRLDVDHGLAVARLPPHHRDPFDRLLIAQAQAEHLTVLTADPQFRSYDIAVIEAG